MGSKSPFAGKQQMENFPGAETQIFIGIYAVRQFYLTFFLLLPVFPGKGYSDWPDHAADADVM